MVQPTIETVLSEPERSYYVGLWTNIAGVDAEILEASRIPTHFVPFSMASGVDKKSLGSIWRNCTSTSTLTKLEFFKYLRYIAIYQNNVREEMHEQYVLDAGFPFLPKFDGIPQPDISALLPKGLPAPSPTVAYPAISAGELMEYESNIAMVRLNNPYSR